MTLLPIVAQLENLPAYQRFELITQILTEWDVPFTVQTYPTGRNLLVLSSGNVPVVGVSSHYDVVPESPGANDNASAVVVCLAILERLRTYRFQHIGVGVFFFDQEETGLKGSRAFVAEQGVSRMQGLINLEMVGQGDQFALWPLDAQVRGPVLDTLERTARNANVPTHRFDRIVTNTADHIPFRQAGLTDVFTLTCISDTDRETAAHYYRAMEFDVDKQTLFEILQQAPLFRHYHQPTDRSEHLSEHSLQLVVDTIWHTLLQLDMAGE